VIVFDGVTMSKLEDDEGIEGEVGGKKGNGCFQSAFTNSSQIQSFFSHVKQ
jgi:hypothetical protein